MADNLAILDYFVFLFSFSDIQHMKFKHLSGVTADHFRNFSSCSFLNHFSTLDLSMSLVDETNFVTNFLSSLSSRPVRYPQDFAPPLQTRQKPVS